MGLFKKRSHENPRRPEPRETVYLTPQEIAEVQRLNTLLVNARTIVEVNTYGNRIDNIINQARVRQVHLATGKVAKAKGLMRRKQDGKKCVYVKTVNEENKRDLVKN